MAAGRRLQALNLFLRQIGRLRHPFRNPQSDLIFEMYCYFLKVNELMRRGKTPTPRMVVGNFFAPHAKPGNPQNASYISFEEPDSETWDLHLNCRFEGKSRVLHSPDIVLKEENSDNIISIYECKNHSGTLQLSIYREFLGYIEEMAIPKYGQRHFRGFFPEFRPCIYTSALAGPRRRAMLHKYHFDVIDNL